MSKQRMPSPPAGVIDEISPRDHMYNSDPRSYGELGQAGLDAVKLAMLAAGKKTAKSILDLPSGHGRVLRFLKAEFPHARLTACDIDHEAVDFCARTFAATPLYGQSDPKKVDAEERFDVVWCGSLVTHLDEPLWTELLQFFESVLAPTGLLVFSTAGREVADRLRYTGAGRSLMDDGDKREDILRGYERTGFGYSDYKFVVEHRESLSLPAEFGISLAKPSWVCGLLERDVGLRLVMYIESRWGGQDVIGCVQADPDPVSVPDVERIRRHLRSSSRVADAAIVSTLAYAGLRPREVLGLRWSDVGEDHIVVRARADDAGRTVRLLAPLGEDLAELRNASSSGDGAVFGPLPEGEWRTWTQAVLNRALKDCGIKSRAPYELRHTFVRLLFAQGASASEVARETAANHSYVLDRYKSIIRETSQRGAVSAEQEIRKAREES